MAVDFRDVFDRLDESFTVQLIGQDLDIRAENEPVEVVRARARAKMFDTGFIGRPRGDRRSFWVSLVVNVASGEVVPLDTNSLVAGSMSLSAAIGYLAEHPFALLLTGDRVTAVVTRADLNHMPVRIMLFALIAHAEMLLTEAILLKYDDDSWMEHLGPGQQEKIRDLHVQKKLDDSATLLIHCASLGQKCTVAEKRPELLQIFEAPSKIRFRGERDAFKRLRNRIFHHQGVTNDTERESKASDEADASPPEDILRDKLAHGDQLSVSAEGVQALDEAVKIVQRWIDALTRWLIVERQKRAEQASP